MVETPFSVTLETHIKPSVRKLIAEASADRALFLNVQHINELHKVYRGYIEKCSFSSAINLVLMHIKEKQFKNLNSKEIWIKVHWKKLQRKVE